MRAIDAMFVWTPNRDIWAGRPTAGQVEVTRIPEAPALRAHPMSCGACDLDWREFDDAGRLAFARKLFAQMVLRDNIAENVVRTAFEQVDEFVGERFVASEELLVEDED